MRTFAKLFSMNAKAADPLAKEVELLHQSPLVDPVWYRQTYPDLRDTPIDVARHYLEHGAAEGRNPHPLFDTKYYLTENPDVAAVGMNPLVHFIMHGAKEGRNPHPHFDTNSYLARYADVAASGLNPLAHYVLYGAKEGRIPRPDFKRETPSVKDLITVRQDLLSDLKKRHIVANAKQVFAQPNGASQISFSVVIAVYNHKHYVREAIESTLSSSLVSEVLVVDDGSTDGSRELLETLCERYGPNVKLLEGASAENMGAHERLNQLCRAATGSWIAVLNSDDQFCPNRLEIARDIARSKNCDFISGTLLIIDEASSIIGTKRGHFEPEYPLPFDMQNEDINESSNLFWILCAQNVIATTSNMIFSKELFTRLGGFRDLRYCHDWDFALRACLLGKAFFASHPLTKYRAHATNTIKEPSPHVDGEVVRLFAWLLEDYPWIEEDQRVVAGLRSNRHLRHFVSSCDIGRRPEASNLINVCFSAGSGAGVTEAGELTGKILLPSNGRGFAPRALANVVLCLAQQDYEFVLLSETLEELPTVHIKCVETNVIYRQINDFSGPEKSIHARRGRLLRHVPAFNEANLHKVGLKDIPGFQGARWEGADIIVGLGQPQAFSSLTARPLNLPTLPSVSGRPRCLIFPIFMALGGVERNTIEIIRVLKAKYDFLVVTSEHLWSHQGSLHYQLDELGVPCLDLAEVANPDRHIVLLETINQSFKPDVVYVCNGSPWLVHYAIHFRRVFGKAAIVDQQVYDTEVGWIEHYRTNGIQSFDRFIATNERIMRKFVSDLRIPKNRVDLIYSGINSDRLRVSLVDKLESMKERRAIGIDHAGVVFGFIGRLTPQKRPLDFLDLARRSQASGNTEHFLLIGDGELAGECEEYVRAHRLRNVTRLRKYDNVKQASALIDGLIVVSAFEGLPIALLEMLALGKPALATDVGDIGLVLNKYKSGMVIDKSGDTELSWTRLLEFRRRFAEFSDNAMRRREDVLERFSAKTIARAYDQSWSMAMKQVPK